MTLLKYARYCLRLLRKLFPCWQVPDLNNKKLVFYAWQYVFFINTTSETAARTMGELCRKFGEKILAEIIAILQTSSVSNDDRTREGTCLALSEIL